MGHSDIRVSISLIVGLEISAGFKDLGVAEGSTGLELRFPRQFLIAENGVSDETDATHRRAGHDIGYNPHARAHRLREEPHVVYQSGFVKTLDIAVQAFGAILRAGFCGHEVSKPTLIYRFGSAITDVEFGDVFAFEVLGVQFPGKSRDKNKGDQGQTTQQPLTTW